MGKLYEPVLNESSHEALSLPYSPLLPSNRVDLWRFRLAVRERCLEDKEYRKAILQACAEDVVFFIQVFVVFHETRDLENAVLGTFPVALDCDQRDILAWLQIHAGKRDILIEKSRGIGMSYLICAFLIWLWLFRGEKLDIGIVSKDAVSLDTKRPSSLMGKLDIIFDGLPAWMKVTTRGGPLAKRIKERLINLDNNNAILGYASTDEKLRSARFFFLFLDEAAFLDVEIQRWIAAAHGTCPSIAWVSTHNGRACKFYNLSLDERMIRIKSYWWNNTRCARGKYIIENGQVDILDKGYRWPLDYPFSFEFAGKPRSPYVDAAFDRPGIEKSAVLEELYGLAAMDTRQLFEPLVILKARKYAERPLYRGELTDDGEWISDIEGEWRLWVSPVALTGTYVLGADPAHGLAGKAYAALSVLEARTGAQILTAQFAECKPDNFVSKILSTARFLTGPRGFSFCKVIHESTGIGASVTDGLVRAQYPNLYEESNHVGWHNRDRARQILIELGRAVQLNEITLRDMIVADEMDKFEYSPKNEDLLEFAGTDGSSHGDLAIATALAWWGARERRRMYLRVHKPKPLTPEQEPKLVQARRDRELWSNKFRLKNGRPLR